MKVLLVGNPPWLASGYGKPWRLLIPRLRALGHQLSFFATYGFEGGRLSYEGIDLYPRIPGYRVEDQVAELCVRLGADIVIHLGDAWTIDLGRVAGRVRWCGWFPVDTEPLSPMVAAALARSWFPMTFSRHGVEQCRQAGIVAHHVPIGVDTRLFMPRERREAREIVGLPVDAFVIGMVAANIGTPSRKALPQCIDAFAVFRREQPDAFLYLHGTDGSRGEGGGVDLKSLVAAHGMGDSVRFADAYHLHRGFTDGQMAPLFAAFDVLLCPSLGEGFGIPIIEAQAAGCPVIVGDWTGMSELCFAGWRIDKSGAEIWWTPYQARQYLPMLGAIVAALREAHAHARDPDISMAARQGAMAYDIDRTVEEYWKPVLAEIEARVRGEAVRVSRRLEEVHARHGDGTDNSAAGSDLASSGTGRVALERYAGPDGRGPFACLIRSGNECERAIYGEVVTQDVYRLRALCNAGFRPRTFVDLGTAFGAASLFARVVWPDVRICAVDAWRPACGLARANLDGIPDARVLHAALAPGFQEVAFYECVDPPGMSGSGFAVPSRAGDPAPDELSGDGSAYPYTLYRRVETVRALTFDRILAEAGFDYADFVKADCEGGEVFWLRCDDPREFDRVGIVTGEWHDPRGFESFARDVRRRFPGREVTFRDNGGGEGLGLFYVYPREYAAAFR